MYANKFNIWLKILLLVPLMLLSCKKKNESSEEAATPSSVISTSDSTQAQKESNKIISAILSGNNQNDLEAAAKAFSADASAFHSADLLKNPDLIAEYLTRTVFTDQKSLGIDKVVDALIKQAKIFMNFSGEDAIKVKIKNLLSKIANSQTEISAKDFHDKILQIVKIAPIFFAGGIQPWNDLIFDKNQRKSHHEVDEYFIKMRNKHKKTKQPKESQIPKKGPNPQEVPIPATNPAPIETR